MKAWIGTSGWSYPHWTDVLYPVDLEPRRRFEAYCAHFDTVELNASYYRWPRDSAFESWRRRSPPGFQLSAKAPGWLTHRQRLYAPEKWMNCIDFCWKRLGDVRGILLTQLSPTFEYDYPRLAYYLETVPHSIRHAIEFRHPSWHHEKTWELLQQHQTAYCVMSGAGLACHLRATSRFVYIRLHGPDWNHLYAGSYSDDDLRWWADRIREWLHQDREVYAYFNNDGHGHAVRNAWRLRELLG